MRLWQGRRLVTKAPVFLQAVELNGLRNSALKLSSLTGRHVSKCNNL
jgi:hypothetical protein